MNNMVVHPKTCNFVQWDFDFEWDSDCDIQIRADFIGGFGIKHLKVFGRMAIIFNPLINEIPIVSAISYSFINLPNVDLTFTGLASVAEIGVIKQSVEDVIKVSMASSCLPHRRIYKMTKGGGPNGFLDIYRPPIGVVKIHIESGRGFVIEKRLFAPDDVPDVYLNVFFGAVVPGSSEGVRRTKTIMDECYPVWNETFEFLLWDRGQDIRLEAWDEDEGPLDPDDQLGVSSVTVADLLMSPQRRKELPLYNKEGEKTGEYVTLSCSIDSWTANLSSLLFDARDVKSDQVEKSVDSICGLLVVIINRAFNLPLDKKTAVTHVRTTFNGKEYKSNVVYDYPGYMDALNPVYDSAFTLPLTSSMPLKEDTRITLELMNEPIDEDDSLDPIVVGSTSVTLWELKKHPHNTLTQRRSIDATKNGPILEFRLSLSGIIGQSSSGNIINAGISSPINALPIMSPEHTKGTGDIANREINFEVLGTLGTARITVVGARGLKIEAHLFDFDVPDCYCVVSCGDTKDDEDDGVKRIFTTSIKHNNTSPTWNEHHDWPLEDHGEMVTVTLWDHDEDGRGEDTILGSAKTTIGKLLMAGGPAEVELRKSGRMTGIFLCLQCDIVI
jgi:Ca2+-dependent lipid-binding protein